MKPNLNNLTVLLAIPLLKGRVNVENIAIDPSCRAGGKKKKKRGSGLLTLPCRRKWFTGGFSPPQRSCPSFISGVGFQSDKW